MRLRPSSIGLVYKLRLNLEASRDFAEGFRAAMRTAGRTSVYALFLAGDAPRSSLYRWLSGKTTIPIASALAMLSALESLSAAPEALTTVRDILKRAQDRTEAEDRILTEFRLRRVPQRRAMEALRAARTFKGDTQQ